MILPLVLVFLSIKSTFSTPTFYGTHCNGTVSLPLSFFLMIHSSGRGTKWWVYTTCPFWLSLQNLISPYLTLNIVFQDHVFHTRFFMGHTVWDGFFTLFSFWSYTTVEGAQIEGCTLHAPFPLYLLIGHSILFFKSTFTTRFFMGHTVVHMVRFLYSFFLFEHTTQQWKGLKVKGIHYMPLLVMNYWYTCLWIAAAFADIAQRY